jgi:hypothetical protein
MLRRTAGNDELSEAQWNKDLQLLVFEYQAPRMMMMKFRFNRRVRRRPVVHLGSSVGSRRTAGASSPNAAGLADVGELGGELEQAALAACYFLLRGHAISGRLDEAATPS